MRKRLRNGRLESSSIDLLAYILSQFYNRADSSPKIDAFAWLATIRKKLFMDRNQSRLGFEEGIYSKEATSITYGRLLRLAWEEIEKQNSVILDATFSRKKYRREVLRLAEQSDANIFFLECVCSDAVIKDRLQKRNTVPSISDARL